MLGKAKNNRLHKRRTFGRRVPLEALLVMNQITDKVMTIGSRVAVQDLDGAGGGIDA